jgi:hypothetical protein
MAVRSLAALNLNLFHGSWIDLKIC